VGLGGRDVGAEVQRGDGEPAVDEHGDGPRDRAEGEVRGSAREALAPGHAALLEPFARDRQLGGPVDRVGGEARPAAGGDEFVAGHAEPEAGDAIAGDAGQGDRRGCVRGEDGVEVERGGGFEAVAGDDRGAHGLEVSLVGDAHDLDHRDVPGVGDAEPRAGANVDVAGAGVRAGRQAALEAGVAVSAAACACPGCWSGSPRRRGARGAGSRGRRRRG